MWCTAPTPTHRRARSTTFFQSRDGRAALDSWSKRLASYRTADITRIRWLADGDDQHVSPVVGLRAV